MAGRPKGSKNKPAHLTITRKEEVLKNLALTHGIVDPACKPLGITRWQVYLWVEEDPDFAKRFSEIKEASLDFVETKLYDLANKGNVQALTFMARCLLGGRGWKYNDTEVKIQNNSIVFQIGSSNPTNLLPENNEIKLILPDDSNSGDQSIS